MFILVLLALWLYSCRYPFVKVVELGNNFAFVQADDADIVYDRNGTAEHYVTGSTLVIPAQVVAYGYDKRWIIAKTTNHLTVSYWIIDKQYNFSRLGYEEEIKAHTIGPMDSIQFVNTLKKYGIKLVMQKVDN